MASSFTISPSLDFMTLYKMDKLLLERRVLQAEWQGIDYRSSYYLKAFDDEKILPAYPGFNIGISVSDSGAKLATLAAKGNLTTKPKEFEHGSAVGAVREVQALWFWPEETKNRDVLQGDAGSQYKNTDATIMYKDIGDQAHRIHGYKRKGFEMTHLGGNEHVLRFRGVGWNSEYFDDNEDQIAPDDGENVAKSNFTYVPAREKIDMYIAVAPSINGWKAIEKHGLIGAVGVFNDVMRVVGEKEKAGDEVWNHARFYSHCVIPSVISKSFQTPLEGITNGNFVCENVWDDTILTINGSGVFYTREKFKLAKIMRAYSKIETMLQPHLAGRREVPKPSSGGPNLPYDIDRPFLLWFSPPKSKLLPLIMTYCNYDSFVG